MHHDHDHELVMSLAEGTLAADGQEMRSRVGDCEECLEEVRLQRAALAVLHAAPAVGLDDLESLRLRRQIAATLGHEPSAPVTEESPKRRIAWAPLASIAAVLLAIVLVAPSLDLVGGDSDDSGDMQTALDQELSEADDTADSAGGDDGAGSDAATSVASENTRSAATEQLPPDTTMAISADTTAAAAEGDLPAEEALTPLGEILALVIADGDEVAVDELNRRDTFAYEPSPPDECAVEGAVAVGGLVESSSLGIMDLGGDGLRVIVTVHRAPRGETTVVAHDPGTCSVLLITP